MDSRVIVPATFMLRGAIAASFKWITDPRDWYGYLASVLIILVSQVQFISVEVLFLRKMNGHVRGTLSGMAFFFGSLGATIFTLVGGIMFDKVGSWAPFMLVAGADGTVLLFAVIFIGCGMIGRYD